MRHLSRALLVGVLLAASMASACAEPIQFNATTTNSSGQTVIGPVPVDASHPLPVTGGTGGGGDASAANQTAVQATAGSDASKAVAVQGITGGKAVPVSASALPLPTGAATSANQSTANTSLGNIDTSTSSTATNTSSTSTVLGSKTDAKSTATDSTSVSMMQVMKQISASAQAGTTTTGSAAPASAIYVGANSGGNLTGIIQADSSVKLDISTATTIQLVALSSSKKIYVTAWDVVAAGTGNIKLVYGTGSNCGTGTTDLTGNYNLTAQSGLSKGSGLGPVIVVPASQALCATTSAAVQMSGSVAYTQF